MYSGGSGASDARDAEIKRQRAIDTGMKQIDAKFSEFGDDFYKQRQQDYINTVTPQLNQQFDKTKKDLAYQLARSGLTTSSAAIDKTGSLNRELATKQREVADAGLANANSVRGDVESQRNNLVAQLNASGDPASINAGLLTATSNLRAPSPVGPVGDFFAGWTRNYLANQNARAADSSVQPIFSFGGNNQSSTIVR